MVNTLRPLLRRVVLGVLLTIASQADAQNVFRVRFDTVVAKAGDVATVNVLYTFTSTRPHSIRDLTLRFLTDALEVQPIGYLIDGTALATFRDAFGNVDSSWSHTGFAARGEHEIDLSNPVLIRVQFRIDPRLADTAFLHFDRSFGMFAENDSVDVIEQEDGWIRTESVAGHVVIRSLGATIQGETEGFSPDPVPFVIPMTIMGNADSAILTFSIDSTRLVLDSVTRSSIALRIVKAPEFGGRERVEVYFDTPLSRMDSAVLHFTGLVGLDTVCEALTKMRLLPRGSDAPIGNTIYIGDSICLEGHKPTGAVSQEKNEEQRIAIYPNPARERVWFEGATERSVVRVYDALGRTVSETRGSVWSVPPSVGAGSYEVMVRNDEGKRWVGRLTLVP
jgi:hypothetical protein